MIEVQTLPTVWNSWEKGRDGRVSEGLGLLLQKRNNNLGGKLQFVSQRVNFLNIKVTPANNKQSPTSQ